MESLEEQLIRVPWQIICEVCIIYKLTKAEFEQLTWDEFVSLYRLIAKGETWSL